jgi:DNA-binding response OmpR family regulator
MLTMYCGLRAGDNGQDSPVTGDLVKSNLAGTPLSKPKILLVEDDYIVAMEAEHALTEAGYQIIGPASSAATAVSLAATECPALVIMDIRLSGKRDGIDAAREIFETTGIRCVFATAHTTPEIRARAESLDPLDWLAKPYSGENLVERVRAALTKFKG